MTLDRFLAWIDYAPSGIRKALCELTGGHDSELLCAWSEGSVSHVRMRCLRCGREGRWFPIKTAPPAPAKRFGHDTTNGTVKTTSGRDK
jgi:hypothetical protein